MRLRFVARLGPHGSRLQPFMVGSLAIHMAAGVFFALLPALRRPAPMDDAFFVDLVSAGPVDRPAASVTPGPPAQQPASPPPEPEPEVEPEGARVETQPIVETTKPPPKTPEKKPEPPKPRLPDPVPARESAVGSAGGDPTGGLVLEEGGAGIGGGLETGGSELSWYNSAVASALGTNWRQPGSTSPTTLRVEVRFEILRDGSVRGVELLRSSGVGILDRSVLRAVASASPLPPIPRDWSGASYPARYMFELNPEE